MIPYLSGYGSIWLNIPEDQVWSVICFLHHSYAKKDIYSFHRILINHEHKRYRKRSRKPAPWFEPRKTGKLTYGVTDENVADLKQQVWEDSFKPDSPIRAEFLERKGLTDNMIASQYQVDKNFKWKFKWERYWKCVYFSPLTTSHISLWLNDCHINTQKKYSCTFY